VFRLLNRYIFREILTSATLGTLLATFVIFLRTVDQLFELLVQGNALPSRRSPCSSPMPSLPSCP